MRPSRFLLLLSVLWVACGGGGNNNDCQIDADCNIAAGEVCLNGQCIVVACENDGGSCDQNSDCCSLNCQDGVCEPGNCTNTGDACTNDAECCSNDCTGGICAPGGNCTANGNSCVQGSECCSGLCQDGVCEGQNNCDGIGAPCDNANNNCCDGLFCADNDGDGSFACEGAVAGDVICGQGNDAHICQCADGIDNDGDGLFDSNDPQCLGAADDNELEFATGVPGDNNGANGATECPFDGNSGIGNDDECCGASFLPNGCDPFGCCEVDGNRNGTSEGLIVSSGVCREDPDLTDNGTFGVEGGPCNVDDDCGSVNVNGTNVDMSCVTDFNGSRYCSTCRPCTLDPVCANPCDPCEDCVGPQNDPANEPDGANCVNNGGQVCLSGINCTSDADCNAGFGEFCDLDAGKCATLACDSDADCPLAGDFCSLGCCVIIP